MLAESMTHLDTSKTTIIATSLGNVAANTVETDLSTMKLCNHEEADSRLLLHVLVASNKVFRKVFIVAVDTDIVVISLYHSFSFKLEELCVEIDVGQHRRWLPEHKYAAFLKE